jgi:hypothetical protein
VSSSPTPGDDDEVAADCIRSLGELHRSLGTIRVHEESATAFLLGYGWWVRVVRTAEAVCVLHENDLDHEASPLVRTLLHHTAALAWLRDDQQGAIEAVTYDHQRRRQRLGQKATAQEWDLSSVKLGPPPSGEKPAGLIYLDQFEKLCQRVGAENVYVAHMIESGYVHPSGISSDTYLHRSDDGVITLRHSATISGVPLRTTAVFAAVAARIMGDMIGDARFTETADEIGRRLGVPTTL